MVGNINIEQYTEGGYDFFYVYTPDGYIYKDSGTDGSKSIDASSYNTQQVKFRFTSDFSVTNDGVKVNSITCITPVTTTTTTSTTTTSSTTTTIANDLLIIREWRTYGDDNNPFSPHNVYSPYGVCVDDSGYVYVSDDEGPIYKINPVTNTSVVIPYTSGDVRGLAWLNGLWVNNGTHVTKINEDGNVTSSIHPSWLWLS